MAGGRPGGSKDIRPRERKNHQGMNEEEHKLFSKYVRESSGPINDKKTAVDWCSFVDGKIIHAKSSSQIRNQIATVDRNQRIKERERKNRTGRELLAKLHEAITPELIHADTAKEADTAASQDKAEQLPATPAKKALTAKQTPNKGSQISLSNKNKSRTLPPPATELTPLVKTGGRDSQESLVPPCQQTVDGNAKLNSARPPLPKKDVVYARPTHVLRPPGLPPTMPTPKPQALHNSQYSIVGGCLIGTAPTPGERKAKLRQCVRCVKFLRDGYECGGRGGEGKCVYYEKNGTQKPAGKQCKRCIQYHGVNARTVLSTYEEV